MLKKGKKRDLKIGIVKPVAIAWRVVRCCFSEALGRVKAEAQNFHKE